MIWKASWQPPQRRRFCRRRGPLCWMLLAEGAYWQIGNLALETPRAFDVSQSQLLLQTAGRAAGDLQRMQTDGDALIAQLIAAPAAEKMAICERLGERLFGKGFRLSAQLFS